MCVFYRVSEKEKECVSEIRGERERENESSWLKLHNYLKQTAMRKSVCVRACLCVCVCVREKQSEREKESIRVSNES